MTDGQQSPNALVWGTCGDERILPEKAKGARGSDGKYLANEGAWDCVGDVMTENTLAAIWPSSEKAVDPIQWIFLTPSGEFRASTYTAASLLQLYLILISNQNS